MGPQSQSLGIVLRSVLYEEKNRMVTVLTEDRGRVTFLAKNAVGSRRFGGTLEILNASDFYYRERPGSEILFLESATSRKEFLNIRSSFDALMVGSAVLEILLKVTPESTPTPELFRLAAHALQNLDDYPNQFSSLLSAFIYKILVWSGIRPSWGQCYSCQGELGADGNVLILVPEASVACSACTRMKGGVDYNRELSIQAGVFQQAHEVLLMSFADQMRVMSKANEPSETSLMLPALERLLRFHIPGLDQGQLKSLDLSRSWSKEAGSFIRPSSDS